MLKLTYVQATDRVFQGALMKLANTATDGKSSYMIKKIFAPLKKQRDIISDEYMLEVVKPFVTMKEGETFDPKKFNMQEFELPEDKQEAFGEAQKKFSEKEFSIPRNKLMMREIRDCKLSAEEQLALEIIVDDSDMEGPGQPVTPMSLVK